jgi:hypothetical protein
MVLYVLHDFPLFVCIFYTCLYALLTPTLTICPLICPSGGLFNGSHTGGYSTALRVASSTATPMSIRILQGESTYPYHLPNALC